MIACVVSGLYHESRCIMIGPSDGYFDVLTYIYTYDTLV